MNVATRCFGHPQVPNEIAMVPLLDLVNHSQEQTTVKFYLTPHSVNLQMIDVEIDRVTNEELEEEAYRQTLGFKQEIEDGSLCQDLNQHIDEYPNRYFNYKPVEILGVSTYPPQPNDGKP